MHADRQLEKWNKHMNTQPPPNLATTHTHYIHPHSLPELHHTAPGRSASCLFPPPAPHQPLSASLSLMHTQAHTPCCRTAGPLSIPRLSPRHINNRQAITRPLPLPLALFGRRRGQRFGGEGGRAGVQACNSTVVAKRLLDPQFSHVCGNAHAHTNSAAHRKSQI